MDQFPEAHNIVQKKELTATHILPKEQRVAGQVAAQLTADPSIQMSDIYYQSAQDPNIRSLDEGIRNIALEHSLNSEQQGPYGNSFQNAIPQAQNIELVNSQKWMSEEMKSSSQSYQHKHEHTDLKFNPTPVDGVPDLYAHVPF